MPDGPMEHERRDDSGTRDDKGHGSGVEPRREIRSRIRVTANGHRTSGEMPRVSLAATKKIGSS